MDGVVSEARPPVAPSGSAPGSDISTAAREGVRLPGGRFVSSALVYAGGNVAQRFAGLLLTPLFVVVFTPAEYGVWGVLVTLVGVIGMLLDLGLRGAVLRYYYDYADDPDRLEPYLSASAVQRVATVGAGSLLALGALALLWPFFTGDVEVAFWPSGALVVLTAAGSVFTEYGCGLHQAQRQPGRFVAISLTRTLLQLGGSVLLVVVVPWGVVGALAGQALGALVAGVGALGLHLVRYHAPPSRWPRGDLRENLSYGLPLVPHKVASWLRNASDRLILVQFVPMAALGVYHFGYALGSAFSLAVMSLDLAFTPVYFQLFKEHEGEARGVVAQSVHVYAGLLTVAAVGLMVLAEPIVALLGGAEYAGAARVVPLIVASFFYQGLYTVIVKPLFYHKRTRLLPWFTFVPGVLSVVLNLLLVPRIGIMGAVWVTFVSYLATLGAVALLAQRIDPLPYSRRLLVGLCAGVGGVAVTLTYGGSVAGAPGVRAAAWALATLAVVVYVLRPNYEGVRRLLRLAA